MTSDVKVSVVIPTYNHARWLADAIDSALAQDASPLEVLVYDNVSTDETPEICARYAADPRFRSIRATEHVPMAANWNRALAEAKGEYLCLLSSDDWLLPGGLRVLAAALDRTPGALFAQGSFHPTDAERRVLPTRMPWWPRGFTVPAGVMLSRYLAQPRTAIAAALFRKSAFDAAGGFDATLRIAMDWDFWLKLLERSTRAVFVAHPTAVYFAHPTSEEYGAVGLEERWLLMRRHYESLPMRFAWLRPQFALDRLALVRAAMIGAARSNEASHRERMARVASEASGLGGCAIAFVESPATATKVLLLEGLERRARTVAKRLARGRG